MSRLKNQSQVRAIDANGQTGQLARHPVGEAEAPSVPVGALLRSWSLGPGEKLAAFAHNHRMEKQGPGVVDPEGQSSCRSGCPRILEQKHDLIVGQRGNQGLMDQGLKLLKTVNGRVHGENNCLSLYKKSAAQSDPSPGSGQLHQSGSKVRGGSGPGISRWRA